MNLLFAQSLRDGLDRLLIRFRVMGVQLVDLLQDGTSLRPLRLGRLLLTLDDTAQRSHSHPEELIQVIGVDAQETQPLQHRHLLAHRLLQDATIEIHPTNIAGKDMSFRHSCLNFFSCHIHSNSSFLTPKSSFLTSHCAKRSTCQLDLPPATQQLTQDAQHLLRLLQHIEINIDHCQLRGVILLDLTEQRFASL